MLGGKSGVMPTAPKTPKVPKQKTDQILNANRMISRQRRGASSLFNVRFRSAAVGQTRRTSYRRFGWKPDAEDPHRRRPVCAQARTRFAGLGFPVRYTRRLGHRAMKQSKVGALPQTPPGAEPLDLNT
jgi:hypothetical protein